MATNFTNKYMQVFQNYNEFGEHSADYVRGEDHIAFLIEENEVIYWLYLEQVWRPLNVRTTTTGELEDGRTKVAVRLEYVEGGQKYTSVPNIPDPERITSMSHFLEDYPDIEEVNVSGTVNLTNLSYAFAGSKIKDFSMLDTSNVTNIQALLMDVDNENGNYEITTNAETLWLDDFILGAKFDTITINALNANKIYGNVINSVNTYIKKLICNYKDDYNYEHSGAGNDVMLRYAKNLEYIKYPNIIVDLECDEENKELDIETNILSLTSNIVGNGSSLLNINTNSIIYEHYSSPHDIKSKWILQNKNDITFRGGYPKVVVNFSFGYGIKGDYDIIANGHYIGNFWFTTPIVDDNFYADKQYPVSILQYKTTFEEVADVNITEVTDSNLIYVDWGSIDFDTSEMSIEIHNIIDITNIALAKTFNNIIIDNRGLTEELEKDDLPILTTDGREVDNNGYISGNYKSNDNVLFYSNLFKDLNYYNFIGGYNFPVDCFDSTKDYNIKLYPNQKYKQCFIRFNYISCIHNPNITYFNIDNLIINNILTFDICNNGNIYNYIANYVENTSADIYVGDINLYLYTYYEYLKNSNINNQFNIKNPDASYKSIYLSNNIEIGYEFKETPIDLDTVYINMENKNNLFFYVVTYTNIGINDYAIRGIYFKIKNILGNINMGIPRYIGNGNLNFDTDYNNTCHINIQLSIMQDVLAEGDIRWYSTVLDNETTINLITKLVDNTSSTSKTIYMYRSQSNIIGEENIAAAVAKNYEFAIIEN